MAQMDRISHPELAWQSKLVLLAVMPAVAAGLVLQAQWWAVQVAPVAIWTVGLSLLLGLVVLKLRAATLAGAATGAAITASLMFSTTLIPWAGLTRNGSARQKSDTAGRHRRWLPISDSPRLRQTVWCSPG